MIRGRTRLVPDSMRPDLMRVGVIAEARGLGLLTCFRDGEGDRIILDYTSNTESIAGRYGPTEEDVCSLSEELCDILTPASVGRNLVG